MAHTCILGPQKTIQQDPASKLYKKQGMQLNEKVLSLILSTTKTKRKRKEKWRKKERKEENGRRPEKRLWGGGDGSVVKYIHSMYKVSGSIPCQHQGGKKKNLTQKQ